MANLPSVSPSDPLIIAVTVGTEHRGRKTDIERDDLRKVWTEKLQKEPKVMAKSGGWVPLCQSRGGGAQRARPRAPSPAPAPIDERFFHTSVDECFHSRYA